MSYISPFDSSSALEEVSIDEEEIKEASPASVPRGSASLVSDVAQEVSKTRLFHTTYEQNFNKQRQIDDRRRSYGQKNLGNPARWNQFSHSGQDNKDCDVDSYNIGNLLRKYHRVENVSGLSSDDQLTPERWVSIFHEGFLSVRSRSQHYTG